MVALTDQAIAKIKDLIMSGEFAADSKLPKEQELAQRLGLSRNSLREAVRALTLIGVLEPRVGDGTYVTSLEPELLLTGMGFVSDLMTGDTLLELHQVRRLLEPVATGMAATRLTEEGFAALEVCLARMDAAETTQAFIAADEEFHRIIVAASGNATLATLIQHLSGGTMRARLWRSVTERGAIETTKQRHWDIVEALRERDAERASAADLIHLSEGEQWLRHMLEADEAGTVVTAVYYEGPNRFAVGACEVQPPGPGEVRLDVAFCGVCGTDVHIAHGHMDHRVRAPQVIGHEMSGTVAELGEGVEGYAVGDPVVVRPLDTRGETPADKGVSHICRDLKFLGIDTPGAFQRSWTVPAFTLHRLPPAVELRRAALTEPLAVACHDVRRGEVRAGETAVVIGGGPIGLLVGLVARAQGATVVLSELSPYRLALAAELGFDVIDPTAADLTAAVLERTGGAGADVVFEVSGSAVGADAMTGLACVQGRIVVVAIFPDPPAVRLFDFFWKELRMVGAGVYEPEDYERAIDLLAADALPLEQLISSVVPLTGLPATFADLAGGAGAMKILVDCQA